MPEPPLISVRTEVVLDTIVGSIHAVASERAEGEGDAWLESMGWHARALERERFARAREPMPWLAERLAADDPGAVSEALAADEPAARPQPGEAPSWRVPGPGGHVRHYLALRACEAAGVSDPAAGKRRWMVGFFRHCCEEPRG